MFFTIHEKLFYHSKYLLNELYYLPKCFYYEITKSHSFVWFEIFFVQNYNEDEVNFYLNYIWQVLDGSMENICCTNILILYNYIFCTLSVYEYSI